MTAKDWPRLIISVAIIAMFGGALLFRYSTGLEETLKAIVMLAVGFWLGSSKGSSDKADQLERQAETPRRVQIDQPPDEPVPVEEKP